MRSTDLSSINQTQPSHLPQGVGTYPITMTPALQAHMHPLHKLGNANIIANYHVNYQTLINNGTANGAGSNAYLTASYVPAKIKCIIMKYRTGTPPCTAKVIRYGSSAR